MDTLAEENMHVLSLVQAMIGAISPNFRSVSLVHRNREVHLIFLLAEESSEDREEIDDIAFELEALLGAHVPVTFEIAVDAHRSVALPGRRVFTRREPSCSVDKS